MRTKRKRTDNSYARYICPDLPCWKAWWKLTDTPKKGT